MKDDFAICLKGVADDYQMGPRPFKTALFDLVEIKLDNINPFRKKLKLTIAAKSILENLLFQM